MSKSTLDSDLYGDIYGDEDNEPESGLPMEQQQLSESNASTTTVHGDPSLYNEPVPRKASVDAHSSLPAKPAPSASSALSYSAQVAKQFSVYQQTPSQERQQRKEKLNSPIQSIATYDGSSMPTVVDSVFGKKPSEMHDAGKMFIGGLSWETTDEGLRDYFSQFGKVDACTIMRDPSGTSRGFAFMTFEDPNAVNAVVAREHVLDGKSIDPKRAIPREEHLKNTRYFVGGLSSSTTSESMRDFFSVYGKVVDATVMVDRDSGRSKGFGFVTFEDSASSDQFVGKIGLVLDDKEIEVKMAQARSQREQTRTSTSSNIGIRDMHEREPRASSTSSVFSSTPSPMATPYQSSISQMPMTGVSMPMLSMNPMMLAMGMGMNGYNGIGVMNPMTMMGGSINMGSMGNMATARMGMASMGASNMGGMMSGIPASGIGYRGLPVNGMSGLVNGNLPRTFMNTGPGPMRLTSRGQHNFHPYTR